MKKMYDLICVVNKGDIARLFGLSCVVAFLLLNSTLTMEAQSPIITDVVSSSPLNPAQPPYTRLGDTLILEGQNLDNVLEVRFFGSAGALATVYSSSATSMSVTVPSGAPDNSGQIWVMNSAGSTSSTQIIEIVEPPVIASISPTAIGTGQSLTLTGENLQYVEEVRFFGDTGVLATITSTSAMQLVVQVPSGVSATSGTILVRNVVFDVTTSGIVIIISPPVITSIEPIYSMVNPPPTVPSSIS